MPTIIRVLLAEDRQVARLGLRTIVLAEPDLTIIGEADNGYEALHLSHRLAPDVLLLDPHTPGPSIAQVAAWLRKHCPAVRLLIFTALEDMCPYDLAAAGAAGCTCLRVATHDIVEAIRAIADSKTWYHQCAACQEDDKEPKQADQSSPIDTGLTSRQLEVLRLVAQDRTNKEIAQELEIAERTVEDHVRNLLEKLGLDSRLQAALWARVNGLVA